MPLTSGSLLNRRYTIAVPLGSGAMGEVYRATDARSGQIVAVKILSQGLAPNPRLLERFRREAEALRRLQHPNIVGYVDSFRHKAQDVIVMEYVPGGSLFDLLRRERALPVERARQITLGLCDALTRAHDLDIVHRDIKP